MTREQTAIPMFLRSHMSLRRKVNSDWSAEVSAHPDSNGQIKHPVGDAPVHARTKRVKN